MAQLNCRKTLLLVCLLAFTTVEAVNHYAKESSNSAPNLRKTRSATRNRRRAQTTDADCGKSGKSGKSGKEGRRLQNSSGKGKGGKGCEDPEELTPVVSPDSDATTPFTPPTPAPPTLAPIPPVNLSPVVGTPTLGVLPTVCPMCIMMTLVVHEFVIMTCISNHVPESRSTACGTSQYIANC